MRHVSTDDIKKGDHYRLKIGGNYAPIRIVGQLADGKGWNVEFVETGNKTHVRSEARIFPPAGETPSQAEYERESAQAGNEPTATEERDTGERGAPGAQPLSMLNAAAVVLEDGTPRNVGKILEEAKARGLWHPGSGKTPANTLYAAILREINTKGDDARFAKVERGQFARKAG